MSAIPFAQIRSASLAQAEPLLREWFPHGRVTGREFKVGNLRGDPGESLSVNLATGLWSDFATGERGRDLIDLRAAMTSSDRGSVARELGEQLGVVGNGNGPQAGGRKVKPKGNGSSGPDDWRPMIPPLPKAPKPDPRLFDGYSMIHEYCGPDDRVLFYVRRREATATKRKQFHPLVYGTLNGKTGWHSKHPPIPKPLYGLNRLSTMPTATVLLCEGEKSADAAQERFPDCACLSWCGGAKAAQHADVSPLAKRGVLIWPDNDAEGQEAAVILQRAIPHARVLRVNDLPLGGDAADINPDSPEVWLQEHLPPGEPDHRNDSPLATILSAEAWQIRDFPEPEPLLGDLILAGVRMFIVGRTGLGKTLLGFAIAVALASGTPFLHWKAGRPCRVLYIEGEMPGALIRERLSGALSRAGTPDLGGRLAIFARDLENEVAEHFPSLGQFQPLNTEPGCNWLLAFIEAVGGADVVILDNVMSLLDGTQKEEESWSRALPLVDRLSRRRIAQIWLDHTPHNADRQYGTHTKSWRFDVVAMMTPLPEDQRQHSEVAFRLSFEAPAGKARRRTPKNWEDFATCVIRLRGNRWTSEVGGTRVHRAKLSPMCVQFYRALMDTIAISDQPGQTTREAWFRECGRLGLVTPLVPEDTHTQREDKRKSFRKYLAELKATGMIGVDGETVCVLFGKDV
jgi:KaiC/GvpD/RAD55 family RecA-like ATPase